MIHRAEHPISRKDISEEALKVLYRLTSLGFKGYLVGGGVRDLYLGKKPKDFDVGTDAKPSRLKRIFRNCRIIGRRFRIAHVFFPGDKIVEVATFRRGIVHRVERDSGVMLIDNEYGTPEEDAKRRDITINGLFYDISTHSIIDYVGGVSDLDNRIIRTINDPNGSFIEDPVRMIRTLRHAARTGFQVEENTLQAIYRNRAELAKANTSRLMEEMFKDLRSGSVEPFFRMMLETHILDVLLPHLAAQLREVGPDHPLWRRFAVLDSWSQSGRELTSAVLLSLLLHTVLLPEKESWTGERPHQFDVWRVLMRNFVENSRFLRISRRDAERVAQILICFRKLMQGSLRGHLPSGMEKKPYFPEAIDFLEADLGSRSQPVEVILGWRKQFVGERPQRAERYAFGAGGFFGGRACNSGAQTDLASDTGGTAGGDAESNAGANADSDIEGSAGGGDAGNVGGEERGGAGHGGPGHGGSRQGGPAHRGPDHRGQGHRGGERGPQDRGGTGGSGADPQRAASGEDPGGDKKRRRRRRGGRRRRGRHHGQA